MDRKLKASPYFFTTDFIVVVLECFLYSSGLSYNRFAIWIQQRKYCTQTSESTKGYFHLKLIAIGYIRVWGKGQEDARSQDIYTTQLQTNIFKVLPGERRGEKADKEAQRKKKEKREMSVQLDSKFMMPV